MGIPLPSRDRRSGTMTRCAPFRRRRRFGTPAYLQAPGVEPALPGLQKLDISFPGGPVTAVKMAEDGSGLIVRLWNVLDRSVPGSLKLPEGFRLAQACDALERPLKRLEIRGRQAFFDVPAHGIFTVALLLPMTSGERQ